MEGEPTERNVIGCGSLVCEDGLVSMFLVQIVYFKLSIHLLYIESLFFSFTKHKIPKQTLYVSSETEVSNNQSTPLMIRTETLRQLMCPVPWYPNRSPIE